MTVTYETLAISERVTQALPAMTGLFDPSQVPYAPYVIGFQSAHEYWSISSSFQVSQQLKYIISPSEKTDAFTCEIVCQGVSSDKPLFASFHVEAFT